MRPFGRSSVQLLGTESCECGSVHGYDGFHLKISSFNRCRRVLEVRMLYIFCIIKFLVLLENVQQAYQLDNYEVLP